MRLDERRNRISLTVYGPGASRPMSSVTLSPTGITLDAGTGKVTVKGASVDIDAKADVKVDGASVNINGKTAVNVDGGLLAVLKARLIRIN